MDESTSGGGAVKLDSAETDVPSVACYKLTGIACPLMNHLKAMMQIVQDQHNQISALKQELVHYKVSSILFRFVVSFVSKMKHCCLFQV